MSIYITPQDELHVELPGHRAHLPALPDPDASDAGRRAEIRGSEPAQAEADRHRVPVRRLRRTDIPQVRRARATRRCASSSPRITLEVERARENFPLTYLPRGGRRVVQGGARLLCGRLLQRVRLHEPAHGAVAVPRARRARQARAVRHAAGNPHARGTRRRQLCRTARRAVRQRQRSVAESAATSMPSAPASCSKSCATCSIKPSCARRGCCRR